MKEKFTYNNAEYHSRRRHDKDVEQNIAKLLDAIYAENNIDFKRVTDIDEQKAGIDVRIVRPEDKHELLVDEKSASTYFQKRLRTFCFELSSENNVNGFGWFAPENDKIKTEYYILAYPYAPNKPKDDLLESVDEMEVLFISKKKIWNYLKKQGISGSDFVTSCIINNGIPVNNFNQPLGPGEEEYKKVYDFNKDIRFVYSTHLAEHPLNIIISRYVLRKLADKVINKIYNNPSSAKE